MRNLRPDPQAISTTAPMSEPRIYQGGLTGTWWCATKWRVRADGVMEAIEKHDVTDQIEGIIADALDAEDRWRDALVNDGTSE